MDNDLKLRNFKLREIIEEEAKSLLNYILKSAERGVVYNEGSKKTGSILSYIPFIACKNNEDWAEIMHELDLIKHFYGNGPPVEINVKWTKKMYKKALDPVDKLIKMTGYEYEIELPRRHVIIIMHKDADGFYSALQIYKKHYNEKRTKITVVPIMPVQLIHELRKISWKYFGVEKLVYILDIAINMSEKKALDDIFKMYSENKNRIESIWIDHHTLEYSRNKLELDWDIKVINISQDNFTCGMLVYNYIEGLRLNIRHYNFAVKLGLKLGIDLNYWKTIFIDNTFKPKYPTKFFERVILKKRSKIYDNQYRRAAESGVRYNRMDLYKTGDGLNFAVMVLENNPITEKILRYLKEYGPEDRVLEFAVIKRTSMNYSIYKLGRRDLRFDVLKEDVMIWGGHMTESISIPAIGLIRKKVENVIFRKRLYLDELISILEGKELEIKDFNKRLRKVKEFSTGLDKIIEYFRTFGVEDTKPIRDNKMYRKYIELYKFYRIFKDMIMEYNYPDPNLLMKLVFKKNITIDTIKICVETGDIDELKKNIYDITGEEYMDEDTENLIFDIFWGVWKHYPDIRIVNDVFIKEYSKLEGVLVELLIYLKIFKKVKLYMLYDYKFMITDFEDENSVSKLVNEFINTYLNDFIAGYEVIYKYDLIKKESDKLIMEKIRQKEGADEYFGRFVKKVKEVYDRLYGGGKWECGGEIREKEKISTHIGALDGILGGGLEVGSVYEVRFMDPMVVNDLVHYLMVSLQLRRKENGTYLKVRGRAKILVLETERYVRLRKLGRVVKAFRKDIQTLVSNIMVAEIRDLGELEKVVSKMGEIIEEVRPIAVIINRVTDIAFKTVQGKYPRENRREYYIKRNKIINNIIKKLREAGNEYGFMTIIINKMKDDALVNYAISDKIKYLHVIRVEKMGTEYKKGSKIIKVEYKGRTSVRPRSVYIEKVGGKYKDAEMNEISGKEILA
ncbi:MAG: hypothetical protein ACTSPY_18165 [Candidatus Helarchaeota archaeon]